MFLLSIFVVHCFPFVLYSLNTKLTQIKELKECCTNWINLHFAHLHRAHYTVCLNILTTARRSKASFRYHTWTRTGISTIWSRITSPCLGLYASATRSTAGSVLPFAPICTCTQQQEELNLVLQHMCEDLLWSFNITQQK